MFLLALLLAAAPPEPEGVVCRYPMPMPPGVDVYGPDVAPCDDLAPLEAKAALGQMWKAEQVCLEDRVQNEADPVLRRELSDLLIRNAEAMGDRAEWVRLVKRHLEEIDASHPDMCLKYALDQSRRGVRGAEETLRWADAALALQGKWTVVDHDAQAYKAYRLRAQAAEKLWRDQEMSVVEGRGATQADAERARARAVETARDWQDFAVATGQDAKQAQALCKGATGGGCEG